MIRLIASDLDGTLIREGSHYLNPEYFDVIRALAARGVRFVAASGRHYSSMRALLEPVADEVIFVAGNGSLVREKDRLISVSALPPETAVSLVKDMRELADGRKINCDLVDCVATESRDETYIRWIRDSYKNTVRCVEDLTLLTEPVIKCAMYCGGDAAPFVPALAERYRGICHVMAAGSAWVDAVCEGTDKAAAVSAIQETLGISREETICFGDNGNDVGMMGCAEESFTVADARDEVKAAARHVLGPVGEDPVLGVLKGLL